MLILLLLMIALFSLLGSKLFGKRYDVVLFKISERVHYANYEVRREPIRMNIPDHFVKIIIREL